MDVLREAVQDTTPEWQEQHTGIAAAELRAFVAEIAADAPRVIFHPGWMTARHKQSFHVSRTALILNALMGSIETEGGIVLAKTPEDIGRKGLRRLADRLPAVAEPRVDGAGTQHPQWDPAKGLLHGLFAALETRTALRHRRLLRLSPRPADQHARCRSGEACAGQAQAAGGHRRALFGDRLVRRRHPARVLLPRARQHPRPAQRRAPGFGLRDQALAPRFDSRPAWWIFREILRRLGLDEALDFETIEELWDYQLEGTGVTVAQLREKGVVSLADALIHHAPRPAQVQDAVGQDRDRERGAAARPGCPVWRPSCRTLRRSATASTCCSAGRRC